MFDLLPHNASPQERSIEAAVSRLSDVAVPIRDLWSAETCPLELLPWLAWAFSVDRWDAEWSEAQKRETVATAIEVQRTKGTAGAVKAAVGALDVNAQVLEWHRQQTPGAPFTYRLLLDASSNAASLAALLRMIEVVDRVKSLRSHLEAVEITVSSRAGPNVAVVASVGTAITVKPRKSQILLTEGAVVI